MKVEITDEAVDEVVVAELKELYRHCDEVGYDTEGLRLATEMILEQYMSTEEYEKWLHSR